ncbi:VOC family protein [Streptomyces kronopolitis]
MARRYGPSHAARHTESWHVLADPEGNEFCLLRTRLQPL